MAVIQYCGFLPVSFVNYAMFWENKAITTRSAFSISHLLQFTDLPKLHTSLAPQHSFLPLLAHEMRPLSPQISHVLRVNTLRKQASVSSLSYSSASFLTAVIMILLESSCALHAICLGIYSANDRSTVANVPRAVFSPVLSCMDL